MVVARPEAKSRHHLPVLPYCCQRDASCTFVAEADTPAECFWKQWFTVANISLRFKVSAEGIGLEKCFGGGTKP